MRQIPPRRRAAALFCALLALCVRARRPIGDRARRSALGSQPMDAAVKHAQLPSGGGLCLFRAHQPPS